MTYPSKTPEAVRKYNKSISLELKRYYEKTYYATEKWKIKKTEKNIRYNNKNRKVVLIDDKNETRMTLNEYLVFIDLEEIKRQRIFNDTKLTKKIIYEIATHFYKWDTKSFILRIISNETKKAK